MFLVCVSDPGRTSFDPNGCKMVMGGANSACAQPPSRGDAGGPYYVRVQKLKGTTQSAARYALLLQH